MEGSRTPQRRSRKMTSCSYASISRRTVGELRRVVSSAEEMPSACARGAKGSLRVRMARTRAWASAGVGERLDADAAMGAAYGVAGGMQGVQGAVMPIGRANTPTAR